MNVGIDDNLRKILKQIYADIDKNGGEVSVSSPKYRQTQIDALVYKGLVKKVDASTLEDWIYILRPTYEGEKACEGENTMRNKAIAQMLLEDIDKCKVFLENPSNEDYGRSVYDEITGRYDSIISDFGKGLYQYFDEQHFYDPDISGETLKYNLKKLMNKMEIYAALKYPAVNLLERNQISGRMSNENSSNKVFIVHGHDNEAKQEMARTLEKAGFEAIILHEQADGGRTIIEKIEKYTDVAFAVVLYTECDLGRAKDDNVTNEKYRARQNVVFEHGYLIGKLGRNRVCALVKGNVETPGDISGVVYTVMDKNGAWKMQLGNNMKDVGIDVDLNKLCR